MISPVFIIAVLVLGSINTIALFAMYIDKERSRRGNSSNRIPEGILFFIATIGGSLGIYAGMLLLRHKTRTWYFQIGIPLLILQQVFLIYTIYVLQ